MFPQGFEWILMKFLGLKNLKIFLGLKTGFLGLKTVFRSIKSKKIWGCLKKVAKKFGDV